MQWDSPWGRGFPGWHIECSAMSMKYLGERLDIHTGGEDNIFPHHECEIAQSEAVTGKPFARFWLHTRHLLVDGKKMSKSLGNFHTVRDVLARGFDPRVLRFALIRAHYRQPLNFTFEGMEAAREALGRLMDFRRRMGDLAKGGAAAAATPDPGAEVDALLAKADAGFRDGLEDDLNVSAALAALFDLVSAVNRLGVLAPDAAGRVAAFLDGADGVLGVLGPTESAGNELDPELQAMLAGREDARKRRDFAESDRLRKALRERGIIVEDTPRGQAWKRAL
jgi:cysteinyl-tRNA synthetase